MKGHRPHRHEGMHQLPKQDENRVAGRMRNAPCSHYSRKLARIPTLYRARRSPHAEHGKTSPMSQLIRDDFVGAVKSTPRGIEPLSQGLGIPCSIR